jgi:hypothetical protein
MRRALAVLMAGVWGAALVTLLWVAMACAPATAGAGSDEWWADRERRLVEALDAYCEPLEYRAEICRVEFEQGFGDPR